MAKVQQTVSKVSNPIALNDNSNVRLESHSLFRLVCFFWNKLARTSMSILMYIYGGPGEEE